MKLLDSEKTELAVLDEGSTKIVYYGKDPALIYFTAEEMDHGTAKTRSCIVKKISGLTGFIVTDAGNEVKLEGTLEEKINILETLLGCKLGYVDPVGVGKLPLPNKTVKFYAENDSDDAGTIKIIVTVVEEEDPIEFEFTRGPNAVTVADVIAKLEAPEGKDIVGLAPADVDEVTEDTILNPTDKLLEDQELVALVLEMVVVKVDRAVSENDTETVEVKVPYTATVEQALEAISADETVKTWVEGLTGTATLKEIVRADGTTIGTKAKKASASTIEEVKLTWDVVPATEEPTGDEGAEQQNGDETPNPDDVQ